MCLFTKRYAKIKHMQIQNNSCCRARQIYLVMMLNPTASKSRTAQRSTPTLPKSSSAVPDAESATSTRPTPSSKISTRPPSPQSSPMPFQSLTTSKRLLFEKKNDSSHNGFSGKVLILVETLIGYIHHHHQIYLPYRITNFKDIYSMLLGEETSGNHQAYRRGHLTTYYPQDKIEGTL